MRWGVCVIDGCSNCSPASTDILQMTKDRCERYHFAGVTRKPKDRFRDASGVLSPTLHFREADLGLFLIIQTHSSRRDDASDATRFRRRSLYPKRRCWKSM